jgi:WD40 repeat protein
MQKIDPGQQNAKLGALSWSPDDRFVACGFHNGKVGLCDAESGRMLWAVPAGPTIICSLAWSADGTCLAAGGAFTDGELRILSAADGSIKRRWTAHKGQIDALHFGSDGTLYSGSRDGTVAAWDAANGVERRRLNVGGGVSAIATSGKTLACGRADVSGQGLNLFSTDSDKPLLTRELPSEPRWIGWIDGQHVAVAACAKNVTYFNIDITGASKDKKLVFKGHVRPIMRAAGRGSLLATAATTNDDAACRVWDVNSGALVAKLEAPGVALNEGCTALDLAHHSRRLAMAPGSGWDLYIATI